MNRISAWFSHLFLASSLRRNASMTLVRQLLTALVQLITIICIARYLGPEGNGLYAMVILLPSMLTTFLNLGIGPATVFFVSRGAISATQAIRENFILACIIATFGVVIALPILLLWGEKIFTGVLLNLLIIGLLSFPFSLLKSFWMTVLQGKEDFKSYNAAVLFPPVAVLVLTGFMLYIDAGVMGVLIAYLIGQVIGLWIVWFYMKKLAIKGVEQSSDVVADITDYKRRLISYGWKAHLGNIMAFINYRADIFLVNFLLSPAATGVYVIAVQISERLWMLSQAISTVLFPRLSSMQDDPIKRYKLTIKAGFVVGGITFIAAGILAFLLYFLIVPVFGEAYIDSLEPFYWLLPGVVVTAISRVYANCIAAVGKPEWNLYTAILVVVVNILGNWLLIPIYGISGAAMATTAAYCLNAVCKVFLVRFTKTLAKE